MPSSRPPFEVTRRSEGVPPLPEVVELTSGQPFVELLWEAIVANITHEVPVELQPAADAALAWINRERGTSFQLTGLVDAGEGIHPGANQPMELGLVLCDGELCQREQVRIEPTGQGFSVSAVEAGAALIPPLLDPPLGVRASWLDDQLEKHEFILLLFYRGLW